MRKNRKPDQNVDSVQVTFGPWLIVLWPVSFDGTLMVTAADRSAESNLLQKDLKGKQKRDLAASGAGNHIHIYSAVQQS